MISEYYGTDGPIFERPAGETGAGYLPDEEVPQIGEDVELQENDWVDLENRIEEGQASNFHVEEIPVPKHYNPFDTEEDEIIFTTALQHVWELDIIPTGYGLLPTEWEDESYPTYEMIKLRQGKELRIALPDFIWRHRAELWGQALDIVDRLMFIRELS